MARFIQITESQLRNIVKVVTEAPTPPKKDSWGRPETINGKPNLWFGFDEKKKSWTYGRCQGIGARNLKGAPEGAAKCRNILGIGLKDKWGRPETDSLGNANLWFGFDKTVSMWVQGPCKGIGKSTYGTNDFIEACRATRGITTRSEMTPEEEALKFQPSQSKNTFKMTPITSVDDLLNKPAFQVVKEDLRWPIQVNYYSPLQQKWPVGHIECVSVKERDYHFNAWPTNMDAEGVLAKPEDKNLDNRDVADYKPMDASTIYVYLTDEEYKLFKQAYQRFDPMVERLKNGATKVEHYNILSQNCADAVALSLGITPKLMTNTKQFIINASMFVSPIIASNLDVINSTLKPKIPKDVFDEILQVYKGRVQWGKKLR